MNHRLSGSGLRRVFNRRVIFDRVSFALEGGETLLITGRNGSGKSTLVKLLARVLTPSAGTIALMADGVGVPESGWPSAVGVVSPYLQLYEEFTARENLDLALSIRGVRSDPARGAALLSRIGLAARAEEPVRTFSSGMKQRMKYALALIHRPAVLILDEPMTNLDLDGIALVRAIMAEQRAAGILVVATNDLSDVEHHDHRIDLAGAR